MDRKVLSDKNALEDVLQQKCIGKGFNIEIHLKSVLR